MMNVNDKSKKRYVLGEGYVHGLEEIKGEYFAVYIEKELGGYVAVPLKLPKEVFKKYRMILEEV